MAGLPTNLIFLKTLMRSVKTTGGMTRKKGMSELQRAQCFQSITAFSSINIAMQDLKCYSTARGINARKALNLVN